MVDKGIISSYRKMNALGLSKYESQIIFNKTISCMDLFMRNYFYLGNALDEVKIELKENKLDWNSNDISSRICDLIENKKLSRRNDFVFDGTFL